MYSWGQNQDGQLGLGDCQGRAAPTLIEDAVLESQNVIKVAFTHLRGYLLHLTLNIEDACRLQEAHAVYTASEPLLYVHMLALSGYMACASGKAPERHFSPAIMHVQTQSRDKQKLIP